ncbi:Putative alpha/Beta hydrolase [Colletotrichum destructivum]|uniref:Alpha/Beta hydrolase n=1 Tax=Colletotrichum destructivum TaxID=34406 RepID=A0AAX4IBN5_9PEZI|nr:Putative alpha/Beta hydrolase [Colletotrichum destructivum]
MPLFRTPTGSVTVYQSVKKDQECITTTLRVVETSTTCGHGLSSSNSSSNNNYNNSKNTKTTKVSEIRAALPEYHLSPPWELLYDDLKLFLKHILLVPFIASPIWHTRRDGETRYPALDQSWVPRFANWGMIQRLVTTSQRRFQRLVDPYFPSGEMDELYPSIGNLICLGAHGLLVIVQLLFLLSLPWVATLPFNVILPYAFAFVTLNYIVCIPLNAGTSKGMLTSQDRFWPESEHWERHDDELWIFLNGVSVGSHWLQGNLNRLSRTFHRPITGIHNKTAGIIFDTIQCLLERCFYFGTTDTRHCYSVLAGQIAQREKIVLILHSQGGLQGSIVVDWLLANYPRETLRKIEIYTFGNAANHFNNPRAGLGDDTSATLGHVEHYGNAGDFVARWGAIHFKARVSDEDLNADLDEQSRAADLRYVLGRDKRQNNFSGLLFKHDVKGHLLNQHYLDRILPLNETLTGVVEDGKGKPVRGSFMNLTLRPEHAGQHLEGEGDRVYQHSRLWKYVNGRSPHDEGESHHRMVNGYHHSHPH